MREWTVHLDIAGPLTERKTEMLLERLSAYAAVVSLGKEIYGVTLSVEAGSARAAVERATALLKDAARVPALEIRSLEVQTSEDLEQSLRTSNVPDLVGVAELARMLKVSKQRISQLARRHDFPRPLCTLASGPIWMKPSVLRFAKTWPRRAGRPRKPPAVPAEG